jgi:hypothetical protein
MMKRVTGNIWILIAVLVTGIADVQADLSFIDDFENRTDHIHNTPTAAGGGVWSTTSGASGNVVLETNSGSTVVRFMTTSAGDGRGVGFADIDNPIENTEKGILFFRFSVRSEGNAADTYLGIHALSGTTPFGTSTHRASPQNYIVAGFRLINGEGSLVNVVNTRDSDSVFLAGLTRGRWYNCWIEADNTADTFNLFISEADGPAGPATLPTSADKVGDTIPFGVATDDPLTGAFFCSPSIGSTDRSTTQSARVFIDEVYWDGDRGLSSLIAQNPDPANNAVDVAPEAILSWEAPDDESIGQILWYDVYMDPNETKVATADPAALRSAAQTETAYDPVPDMLFDSRYFWRVDTMVIFAADPNQDRVVCEGDVWSFTTKTPAPEIVGQPEDMLVGPGETAVFVVDVSSPYAPASYQWYASTDRANNTPADDVLLAGATSETLMLLDVSAADEQFYYCEVSNVYNGKTYTVYSDAAALGVKRKVAHWTLDELVDGKYADSSGQGHHADPNGVPVFIPGVNPALTGSGVVVDPSNGWAHAGTWDPSLFSGQLTISLWVKWAGQTTPYSYQGLIGKRNVYASDMRWQLEIGNNEASLLTFKSNINGITGPILPVDEWEQVVVTYDGLTATMYRNGTPAVSGPVTLNDGFNATMMLGAVGWEPALPTPTSILNGALDDIAIYNYALDPITVAYSYTDITGGTACVNPDDPVLQRYDLDGDCQVGLGDLVMLVEHWLTGQLVPDVIERP